MKSLLTAALLGLTLPAFAAPPAPTASLDVAFTEFTGSILGADTINDDINFYWVYEGSGTWQGQQVDSWLLMWDPLDKLVATGTVTFSQPIYRVLGSQAALMATSGFEKPGVSYDYSNPAIGLEFSEREATTFAGGTLSLSWNAGQPGDFARILTTAVPEPSSWAMLLGGLAAVGFMARRRA